MATEVTLENIVGDGGAYPTLLGAVQADLEKEYDAGRLMGTDYANVYVALVQNALSQAIQFELTKDQVAAQTDLILAQIETQAKQTILVEAQTDQINAQITIAEDAAVKDLLLKDAQLDALAKDDLIKDQQLLKLLAETAVTNQQLINLVTQNTNLEAEGLNIPKQGELLDKQITQADYQTALITAQTAKTEAETSVTLERGGFR